MRALILCLLLVGCAKPYVKPTPVYITQRVPVSVPSELTRIEPTPSLEGTSVYAHLKQRAELLMLVELYARRMKLIRGLPSDR